MSGAKRARNIHKVAEIGGVVHVWVKDRDSGDVEQLTIHDLPRHELLKAAVKAGCSPKTSDGRWSSMTNEEIVAMVYAKYGESWSAPEVEQDDSNTEVPVTNDGSNEGEGEKQDIPEGDGTHEDQPTDMQPEEFEWQMPEELKAAEDDGLDEQAEKLQKAVEQREEARDEYEQQEQEKAKAREEWNNEAREAEAEAKAEREQREQEEEAQRKEDQAEQEEFFEDFTAKKDSIEIPADAHPQLLDIIDALLLGQDIYLAGPAGTGKSYLTEHVCQILGWDYSSISLGPQTPESRFWGYYDANGNYVPTPYRHFYDAKSGASDKGRGHCVDEVDNGHPGITTTMNQSVAGTGCTFPDQWVDRHINARVMCTANTWGQGATSEYMGRNPLDAAFLDRFTKFHIPTDEDLEEKLVRMNSRLTNDEVGSWVKVVRTIRANADNYKIRVPVSMRTAIAGAQLLSIGWTHAKVLDARVLGGLPEGRREHLLAGTGVA